MKCPSLIAVLSISAAAASLAIAEPASNDLAARTELHAIETLTLSDTQFLKGDTNGKATTTSGEFRIAASIGVAGRDFSGLTVRSTALSPTTFRSWLVGKFLSCMSVMGALSRLQIGEGGAENNRFASKAPNALTFSLSYGFIEKVRLLVRPPKLQAITLI
jgi:hypothetical protein